MRPMPLVLIGIQARSTSTRLPNKVNLKLGEKTLLRHVFDKCQEAASYLNRSFQSHHQYPFETRVAILCPENDPIVDRYGEIATIYTGSESDVLSRYVDAASKTNAELVVRVTADCPFTQPHMISRSIKRARITRADYTSNTLIRTFPEGWDTEVISRRLLNFLDERAIEPKDREHVTTLITKLFKSGGFPFKSMDGKNNITHVLHEIDLSDLHTSIDTTADFERATKMVKNMETKRHEAIATGEI